MPGSEEAWKVIRCENCDGLMKVAHSASPDSIACPSCGVTMGEEVVEEIKNEVIRSASPKPEGSQPEPDDADLDLGIEEEEEEEDEKDDAEFDLNRELGAIPDDPKPTGGDDPAIPEKRRDDFQMPQMISNVGIGRAFAPATEPSTQPKIDASRLVSTQDERLAADEDTEEGGVKRHVARKITTWDLEDDEEGMASAIRSGPNPATKKNTLIIVATVAILGGAALAFMLVKAMKEDDGGGGGKGSVAGEPRREAAEEARDSMTELERETLDNTDETFSRAGKVVESFLNAKTFEERLKFSRDAERVRPLMEAYYQRKEDGPTPFREPKGGWKFSPYKNFLVSNVERPDFSTKAVAVELQEDGAFLVDWESFVAYSEIPWEEVASTRPQEPFIARVIASVGLYYNYGYKDDEFACVQLLSPDMETTIYGYTPLKSELLQDLIKIMSLRGRTHLTIRLEHAGEGKADNQFTLVEVIAKGWVFSEINGVPDGERTKEEETNEGDSVTGTGSGDPES